MDKGSFWRRGLAALLLFCLLPFTGFALAQEHATPPPAATPTVDRLAAPPTVPSPTQADEGAQLFWLHCQPCHGDQGQGLTDEWRAQYPEGEQYCWQSGCHSAYGKDLPENGFVLPTTVPAVIGEGSLEKFADAHQLFSFIRGAMPYNAPGNLADEEYLAITAYLARAHGAWDGTPLEESNLAQMRLAPETEPDLPPGVPAANAAAASPATEAAPRFPGRELTATLLGGGFILVVVIGGGAWLLWHQTRQ